MLYFYSNLGATLNCPGTKRKHKVFVSLLLEPESIDSGYPELEKMARERPTFLKVRRSLEEARILGLFAAFWCAKELFRDVSRPENHKDDMGNASRAERAR